MPDPRAVERFFETVGPAFEDLKARSEQARPDLAIGCGFGLAFPVVALFLAAQLPMPLVARLVVALAGVSAAIFGIPRLARFAGKAARLKAPVHQQVVLPFVEVLLPGAAFQRDFAPMDDWNRSRLFATGLGGSKASARLTGTIAGLPAVLDETFWQTSNMQWQFYGWVVRFHLPFAVAGHLRLRHVRDERWVTTNGFEMLPESAARLGDEYVVDVGPLQGEPLAGIVPTVLVTSDLVEWIRTDPGIQVAVAGHDLWVTSRSKDTVFPEHVVNLELETLRRGVQRLERAEAIARCVLAAGGGRP